MATSIGVLSAAAQEAGQAIIFSAPKTDDTQAVTPSLMPQSSQLPTLPDSLLAPMSPLSFQASPDQLPPPPAPVNSAQQQRLRELQAERRNWTMMTPAEIFGVTTPAKLLQPSERDKLGQEKNTTQLERYLDRANPAQSGFTNGWRNGQVNSPGIFSRDEDHSSLFAGGRNNTADSTENFNWLPVARRNNNSSLNQNRNPAANLSDGSAEKKATKEKLEQIAAMERFRQLLQPLPAPSPTSRFFPAPKLGTDPNLTSPDFVSSLAGSVFTPLSSGIGRPAGLPALPGIATPRLQSTETPSWKPQPPPWLSQSPVPTSFPQQKF